VDRRDTPLINWGELTALSALFVAFGAMVYSVGLLAMWIPAAQATQDFALSWYVVSLMPRTTVAGIGVRWSLVGSHLLFVLFLLPLLFLVQWVSSLYQTRSLDRLRPNTLKASAIDISIVVYVSALVWALFHVGLISPMVAHMPVLRYLLLPLIVLYLLDPLVREFLEFGSNSRPVKRRVLRRAAVLIIINFVTSILVISTVGQVARPVAELRVKKGFKTDVTGELWTHTEGFWYVFDQEKNLCAIPDAEVRIVRIWKRGATREDAPKLTSCITS
jgi:hypothetical protein